jgi:hypothetical protein
MATTNIAGEQFTATIEGADFVFVDFLGSLVRTLPPIPPDLRECLRKI